MFFFFFKQKTAYEMRISDWSSDVCSSDLVVERMADVERAGDVGRRDHDRERLGIGPRRAERAGFLPMRIPARLDGGGVEGLIERCGRISHKIGRAHV